MCEQFLRAICYLLSLNQYATTTHYLWPSFRLLYFQRQIVHFFLDKNTCFQSVKQNINAMNKQPNVAIKTKAYITCILS